MCPLRFLLSKLERSYESFINIKDPNGECVFNISKATTKRELCRVEGVDEHTQRMAGINLSGGVTNSVEFCTEMYRMPTMAQMLDAFMKTL